MRRSGRPAWAGCWRQAVRPAFPHPAPGRRLVQLQLLPRAPRCTHLACSTLQRSGRSSTRGFGGPLLRVCRLVECPSCRGSCCHPGQEARAAATAAAAPPLPPAVPGTAPHHHTPRPAPKVCAAEGGGQPSAPSGGAAWPRPQRRSSNPHCVRNGHMSFARMSQAPGSLGSALRGERWFWGTRRPCQCIEHSPCSLVG